MVCFVFGGCYNNSTGKKCYQGTVIVGGCPGYAVQLLNTDIGVTWNYGGTSYRNAISIDNLPNNLGVAGTTIYFTAKEIKTSPVNCTSNLISTPSKIISVENISKTDCTENK